MFRELFGLPAHALIVHAAVVFIPLAAVAAILYTAWPGVRRHIWWAVLGLGVVAPVTAWYARLSGGEYEKWWLDNGLTGPLVDEINQHQALGNVLSWWATGLGVVMLALVLYVMPAKTLFIFTVAKTLPSTKKCWTTPVCSSSASSAKSCKKLKVAKSAISSTSVLTNLNRWTLALLMTKAKSSLFILAPTVLVLPASWV